jgi:carbonic anhydrase/acetyltransferase-like protein (isoleucine patch superfamily)
MIHALGDRQVQFIGGPHFVAHNATLIGSVVLKPNASIWFNVVVRADNDPIIIG